MKTNDQFRQHADLEAYGEDYRAPADPLPPVTRFEMTSAIVCLLIVVVGVLLVTIHREEPPPRGDQMAAAAEMRRLAEADRMSRIAEAYERGLHDAMEAIKDKPDGVALAQACLALRGVR